MKKVFSLLLVASFISSCAVGPDYKRPDIATPAKYRGVMATQDARSLADAPWWDIFKDPVLKGLIDEALKNNLDLRIASARVEQMRELARIKKGDYYPQLNYSATDNYGRNVASYGLPDGKNSNMFAGNVQMQWELDVWGRVRRGSESARAQYLASIEAKRGITLMLITELATAYIELRELDSELEIAKRTADAFKGTYDLFNRKYKGGDASLLETSRAGAALSQVAAYIPYLENQIFEKENQICFLLGRPPLAVPRGQTLKEQYLVPDVPAGLPSTLLERRPDIRQAEQLLISANAEIGVAKADFFPRFGLTGLFGSASPDLKSFSNSWSVGGGLTGPLFNGGKIFANYEATKQVYEQTKLQYEKTVINAFREVADAVNLQQKLSGIRDEQAKSVDFLRTATKLSLDRYKKGLSNYNDVLDAQQQLYPAENDLARTERDRLLAIVQLFKALGGGWNNVEQTNANVKVYN